VNSFARVCMTVAVLAMVLLPANSARSEPPIPSLEQMLTDALERHPEIVAAKAKVALAEAQLNTKRLEVTRQIVALRGAWEIQKQTVEQAQRLFARVSAMAKSGTISIEELEKARGALIDAEAKRAQLETELRYLTGPALPVSAQLRGLEIQRPFQQVSSGPTVTKVREALNRPAKMEFSEQPVKDVADYLSQLCQIPITVDETRLPKSQVVSLTLNDQPLIAVFQAIEDQCKGLQFVIREYGVLLTDATQAREQGFLPILEYWKQHQAESPRTPEKAPPPPAKAQPTKSSR
jgi:Outer membrane efflux protein